MERPRPAPAREAPPLAPIDPRATRPLEQRGRAIFCGLVLDPQGRPCPGARIFHDGDQLARSDARGAWRFETGHDVFAEEGREPILAALKEGVGVACVPLAGRSGRVDLRLERGALVLGRTLERETGRIVSDATVDLLARPDFADDPRFAFAATARSGPDGSFTLGQVPAGAAEIRASSESHDSAGFFSQAIDVGALVQVEVLMDPVRRVSGWFAPWPPPWMDEPFRAEVRAWSAADPRRWYDARTLSAEVGDDARFELALPGFGRYTVALACDRDCYWVGTLESGLKTRDVDLGKIELEPVAEVRGSVDFGADALALGFEVRGELDAGSGSIEVGRALEQDGGFRFGALPDGRLELLLALGRAEARVAGEAFPDPNAEGVVGVAGGERLDLGRIGPSETVFCGRVVDEEGVPVAWTELQLIVDAGEGSEKWSETRADSDGRWCICDRLVAAGSGRATAFRGKLRLRVKPPAWGVTWVDLDFPGACAAFRRDVVLDRGLTLAGVLTAADGEPLVSARVDIWSDEAGFVATDVTSADGRFEFRGLPDVEVRFRVEPPEGSSDVAQYSFPPQRPGGGELSLSVRDADHRVPWRRTAPGPAK